MSASTFSIVRAAHCSIVTVAWMKTIRAPKTSGTSCENKKDLSAGKKKKEQWYRVSAAEEHQYRGNLWDSSKGRTCTAEPGFAAATPWRWLLFQANNCFTNPGAHLQPHPRCPALAQGVSSPCRSATSALRRTEAVTLHTTLLWIL